MFLLRNRVLGLNRLRRKIAVIWLCTVLLLSPIVIAGSGSLQNGVDASEITDEIPVKEHGLGGLWDPEGPKESDTCRIVLPNALLQDTTQPLPGAVDNSAGLPPVGNQYSQGSCTAWAIGYYHTTYIENQENPIDMTDPWNQTSPAFLYNIANGGYDGGSYMSDVADLLISNGACSMAEKEYSPTDHTTWPEEDWIWVSGMKRKAVNQNWLDTTQPGGMDALKAYLAAGNTATTGIYVWGNFDDIENYNNTYSSSERFGTNRGGHVVTICGYDDDFITADGPGALRMVNSWGTGWGDSGYWWMSYAALQDPNIGQSGWIMYLESMLDYTPKMVAKVLVDHAERGDIIRNGGLSIAMSEGGAPLQSKAFLSCYWIEDWYGESSQQWPFPTGRMAFDISEFLPYMANGVDHQFKLTLTNTGALEGVLRNMEILNAEWWEGDISWDTPMAMPAYTTVQTDAWVEPGLFLHLPIRVNSDLDMEHQAIGEFWVGDGTASNPFIIPGYYIWGEGLGNCVFVGNTTMNFIIEDCYAEAASSTEWSDYHADSGIYLYTASNGTVRGNAMYGNLIGLYLVGCNDILAEDNSAEVNSFGFLVSVCTDSAVRRNNVSDSIEYGIYVETSGGISVYHNNLVNNSVQACDDTGLNAWDNDYPSGGNYWSDYSGTDMYSGPDQDQPGSDGIGDTPYTAIDGSTGAQDNYPLMEPVIDGRIQRSPFRINSNADFDWEHGVVNWDTGDGSETNPWIIEDWDVNGTGYLYCIYIGNTTEFFTLRNCYLHHTDIGGIGIELFSNMNGTIENNAMTFNMWNIRVKDASNHSITYNTLNYHDEYGIWLDGSQNNLVYYNYISGGESGLFLINSENNNISYNIIYNNAINGIELGSANNNYIHHNQLNSNKLGIYCFGDFNKIINNEICNNSDSGLYLEFAENNFLSGNTIASNQNYGIEIDMFTNNNEIYHNNIINNCIQAFDRTGTNLWHNGYPSGGNYWSDYSGLDLMSGEGQNMTGSDGIGDTPYTAIGGGMDAQDDYPLMAPWGQEPSKVTHSPIRINSNADFDWEHGVINWATGNGTAENPWLLANWDIDGTGYGYCLYIGNTTEHFTVKDCNLHDASENGDMYFWNSGLAIYNVQNGMIINNTALSNQYHGIRLYSSSGNTIANNTASLSDWYGIRLYSSSANTITNNTASLNDNIGIYLGSSSDNNIIAKNTANSNNWNGILLSSSSGNIVANNNASWNKEYGISLSSSNGNIITNNTALSSLYYGIFLWGSINNTIANNIVLSNKAAGIHLQFSSNNIILNNNASSYGLDGVGIFLDNSINNIIAKNTVFLNLYYGIRLWNSNSNTIYHNNFIDNTNQAYDDGTNFWDNGYPSGGNYWSDYSGTDMYSGPDQDQPGSDGIGDTPYTAIDGSTGALDNYPLMEPWIPPIITVFNISLTTGWNLLSIPLDMADTSVESVLSSITGNWDVVKFYDSTDRTWKTYRVGATTNNLVNIDRTMGVWTHATANCTLTTMGQWAASTQIILKAGWNLVGYSSETEMTVGDALWGTGADRVEVCDMGEPGFIKEVGPDYVMTPGEGYWVHVTVNTVWTIDW
ncbi:MAG: right-handed parallel beta-helix repeat-containing protein [Candidatus Thermoplasmatota archaeon]|nr:hypothetical protein [Euryarchaeota archaeon]MBU4031191.1 right-handed parallel beta-helix repeat-containing protein [Candidatus Thermoplasmatota archaeon]MBU4072468.1 right-handed parallel beta-helix repeat-containing protein [Candidatus Thermoplasmatota archaeon]MBU4143477.1 right-handed parallel beta-helix repeat-containing protein [Candidatus Thermoplasmatota archaeon]MBU4592750.1 right-handed parallel beta-helix repeat-containing protein [Candidatus Thermoplasmatota archaeon]